MSLDNLRDFIAAIDGIGELIRVSHPVRARLEIAEIADRCMKSPGGGPALLFEHVILDNGARSSQPVAINLYGSMRRMCLALGDVPANWMPSAGRLGDAGAHGSNRFSAQAGRSCPSSPRWESSRRR